MVRPDGITAGGRTVTHQVTIYYTIFSGFI